MANWKHAVLWLIVIIYFISPDFIPGWIDDIVVAFIAYQLQYIKEEWFEVDTE